MRKRKDVPKVIVAAKKPELRKNLVTSGYMCKACGNVFESNAGMEPYCHQCGSEAIEPAAVKNATSITEIPESQLSSVKCGNDDCGVYNIFTDELASTLSGETSCIVCGTDIKFNVAEFDSEDEEDEEMVEEEMDIEGPNLEDEDEELFEEMEDLGEETEGDSLEEEPEVEDAAATVTAMEDKGDSDNVINLDGSEDGGNGEGDVINLDGSEDSESDDSQVSDADEIVNDAESEMSSISVLSFVNQSEPCYLLFGTDKVFAMVDEQVVATMVVSGSQYENAIQSGATDNIQKAFQMEVDNSGLEPAFAAFGFNLKQIKVDAGFRIDQEVASKVAEEKAKLEEAGKDSKAVLEQCMGIAAAGLNKGFFANRTHELKVELYNELTSAGFRNPSRVIDKAFEAASDKHNKILIQIANELAEKPEEVRNSLAEAITGAAYQHKGTEEETQEVETVLESSIKETASVSTAKKGRLFNLN